MYHITRLFSTSAISLDLKLQTIYKEETMQKPKQDLSHYDDFRKYSVTEIGNMLGIGRTKTQEMLQSHLLPVTKIGRDYFTSKTAIQEFLTANIGKELFY